jgi:hypothetical protein
VGNLVSLNVADVENKAGVSGEEFVERVDEWHYKTPPVDYIGSDQYVCDVRLQLAGARSIGVKNFY